MVSATMPVTSDNPLLGKWSEMKAILQQLQPTNHTNTENTIHQPIAQEAKIPEIQTKLNITAHVYTLITITDVEESSWTARALLLESPPVRGRAAGNLSKTRSANFPRDLYREALEFRSVQGHPAISACALEISLQAM